MTTIRYYHLDSAYRDRNINPRTNSFLYVGAASTVKDFISDPIAASMPITQWHSNSFDRNNISASNSITFTAGINVGGLHWNTDSTNTFSVTNANLQQIDNYYRGAVVSISGNLGRLRITSYKYVDENQGIFTYESLDNISIVNGTMFTIQDYTDPPIFFVPNGSTIDNFYVGKYILYNESINESASILSYDARTARLEADLPAGTWSPTDRYSIRQAIPGNTGTIQAGSSSSQVELSGVNAATAPLQVGSYLRITANMTTAPAWEVARLISYNSNTNMYTLSPQLTADPTGHTYEILPITADNFHPYVYQGYPQLADSIFFVVLKSLVLPNTLLTNGCRTTDYPYVFVRLQNQDEPQMYTIISNNPNSKKSMFLASYQNYDTTSTGASFIHYSGNGMIMKFKGRFDSRYEFEVILPDGTPFETAESDNFAPQEPNPALQINAIFELRN